MNTTPLRKLGPLLCLIAALAAFGSAFAQAGGQIQVTNAVFVEVVDDSGAGTTRLVPATNVVPGTEVVYRISYRNTGDAAATDLAIDNPLPDALVFVGSDQPPAAVSVDGGATFGALTDLTVIDLEGDVRQAQPSDITNIRWVVATLAPGASGSVVYRARVK